MSSHQYVSEDFGFFDVISDLFHKEYKYKSHKLNNFKYHCKTLFDGIDFKNKKMIDIGGGRGIFSFYASHCGASEVLCLEPEGSGSTQGVTSYFEYISKKTKISNVNFVQRTFQDYDFRDDKYDIILLHNSINHLDEEACITLKRSNESREIYLKIFNDIAAISNTGAHIIICDCSPNNFFKSINIKNPLMPTIEWHKHQSPHTWAKLLLESGFEAPEISWTTFNTFRDPGKLLMGNSVVAFFLMSHFRLKMTKSRD